MRYVALIAACVLLVCTAAVYLAGVGLEMTDDISTYVDLIKDFSGVVLAVAALYLWFPWRGRSRSTEAT